ncbi:unnamed protein product [Leuciscus chuanchicus]
MRFILVLLSTFELQQEPMRFILVLRSTFELQQEPMRFILLLRITFELPQEPMRFTLLLRITFELQQEPMRFILMCQAEDIRFPEPTAGFTPLHGLLVGTEDLAQIKLLEPIRASVALQGWRNALALQTSKNNTRVSWRAFPCPACAACECVSAGGTQAPAEG